MNYKIVEKQTFKVYGKMQAVSMENSTAEITNLWREHYETETNKIICGCYGVCYSDEFGADVKYCIADDYTEGKALPEGCEVLEFEAGSWAIFEGNGAIPNSIIDLTQEIFSEWIGTHKEYEIADNFNIEVYGDPTKFPNGIYDDNYKVEIWVPVMKKI